MRPGGWKYLCDREEEYLFNLDEDVAEKNMLAAQHPEKLRGLKSLFDEWEAQMQPGPTIWGAR